MSVRPLVNNLPGAALGFNLGDIRRRLMLTQQAMADAMGLPLRTYEDLEAGRSKVRQIHINAAEYAYLRTPKIGPIL